MFKNILWKKKKASAHNSKRNDFLMFKSKKSLIFIFILCITILVFSNYSYSYFKKIDVIDEINFVVGDFSYNLQSDKFDSNRQVSVSANSILEFELSITSSNKRESNYQLYYDVLSVEGVSVYYMNLPNYDSSFGKIGENGVKKVKIRVENASNQEVMLNFGVVGGLVNNQEVEVDSTKIKINEATSNVLVSFDANGGSVDVAAKSFVYGESFNSLPNPVRKGYVFNGWYTKKEGGAKIETSTIFDDSTINILYAHWDSQLLVDHVEIGDYVDYGVYYKNVGITVDGTQLIANNTIYTGWRVAGIEKVEGTDERYVKLISAGIPLTYRHIYTTTDATAGNTSVKNLTTNFFTTAIASTATNGKYHLCGFLTGKNSSTAVTTISAVKSLFNNQFTRTNSSGNLMVESVRNNDLKKMLDELSGRTDSVIQNLTDFRPYPLLGVPATVSSRYVPYYSADVEQNYYLWASFASGQVVYTYGERGVRPVVSLKSDVIVSDNNVVDSSYGTYSNPILIDTY